MCVAIQLFFYFCLQKQLPRIESVYLNRNKLRRGTRLRDKKWRLQTSYYESGLFWWHSAEEFGLPLFHELFRTKKNGVIYGVYK